MIYEAVGRRWSIWWACELCGGAKLALRDRASGDDPAGIPPRVSTSIADRPCPACETRRQRIAPHGTEPSVWYDTLLGDWVLWLPVRGAHDGILMPLEIPWFDAAWSEVYRAAGDLAFAADAFDKR